MSIFKRWIVASLLAIVVSSPASCETRSSNYAAKNARPDLLFRVEDVLGVLDAIDHDARAARGSDSRTVVDETTESIEPGGKYTLRNRHGIAFTNGGIVVASTLVIARTGDDLASARQGSIEGVLYGLKKDGGGHLTFNDLSDRSSVASRTIEVQRDGVPFGHVLMRCKERNIVIVVIGTRYSFKNSAEIDEFLRRKLAPLLDFKPEFALQ